MGPAAFYGLTALCVIFWTQAHASSELGRRGFQHAMGARPEEGDELVLGPGRTAVSSDAASIGMPASSTALRKRSLGPLGASQTTRRMNPLTGTKGHSHTPHSHHSHHSHHNHRAPSRHLGLRLRLRLRLRLCLAIAAEVSLFTQHARGLL